MQLKPLNVVVNASCCDHGILLQAHVCRQESRDFIHPVPLLTNRRTPRFTVTTRTVIVNTNADEVVLRLRNQRIALNLPLVGSNARHDFRWPHQCS